ncbi:MAG: hypothetical protein U1E31_00800 [Rickettsiales bacterium]
MFAIICSYGLFFLFEYLSNFKRSNNINLDVTKNNLNTDNLLKEQNLNELDQEGNLNELDQNTKEINKEQIQTLEEETLSRPYNMIWNILVYLSFFIALNILAKITI